MDFSLRPCARARGAINCTSSSLVADRLSSLPDELLIQILCLVSTKDAAALCVLSQRLRGVFSWVTVLDFDDFPISHCVENPYRVESFPTFVTFVENVLQAHQSKHLTRFKLGLGPDYITRYSRSCSAREGGCGIICLPELGST